ncbi:hypothetical protein, partial [Nonomuraea sp. NPDC049607]|uniref:hypothetical protein n=1 Tax=Nonomuraea sp. NPDC049607 TaxID=3154732 RepID=UPI0034371356
MTTTTHPLLTRPRVLTAGVSVLLTGALFGLTATAAAGEFANANGMTLTITEIPEVGQPGFSGTWGTASVGPDPGVDNGDWSDPDNVTQFTDLANEQLQASGLDAPDVWEASASLVVDNLYLNQNASEPLLVTGNVSTHARCTPPAPAMSSTLVTPGSVTVLGVPVEVGTTEVRATGEQLGYPGVALSFLTVVR